MTVEAVLNRPPTSDGGSRVQNRVEQGARMRQSATGEVAEEAGDDRAGDQDPDARRHDAVAMPAPDPADGEDDDGRRPGERHRRQDGELGIDEQPGEALRWQIRDPQRSVDAIEGGEVDEVARRPGHAVEHLEERRAPGRVAVK